ncbi:MAG: hypothetical protein KJO98_15425 [Rhodothermia bacterium]|nr:hypothetical protein [Rhodothermia bacterium]
MTLDELKQNPRQVGADFHVVAARAWRDFGVAGSVQSPLVYAALEYRAAIERVALELSAIIIHDDETKDVASAPEKFSSLLTWLHSLGGGTKKLLYRVLKFNRILSQHIGAPKPLSVPDTGTLHNYWMRLSDLCHCQREPADSWDDPQFVASGYQLLGEVDAYLATLLISNSVGSVSEKDMPQEVLQAKRDFVEERIDEPTLRTRLRLMDPVLESRFRTRHAG